MEPRGAPDDATMSLIAVPVYPALRMRSREVRITRARVSVRGNEIPLLEFQRNQGTASIARTYQ
jgi:hypothetical protein